MQTYAETASKAVAEAENALRTAIEQKDPYYAGFEPLLERFRLASQDLVFLTFATPAAKTAEDRLWDGHVRVNKKYQKHLKQFRDGVGKKKHVERRKAEKFYLHFIKSSMHFYRGYIQRLASHFANVPEVKSIADKLHLDSMWNPEQVPSLRSLTGIALSADSQISVTLPQQAIINTSCHNALMRLGDLSRYRETELEQKDRNWGPAKGHYLLALSLKPESGAAYNQLAVMALADEDHLRAVYHLHRAAAAGKPFPVARDNIKLEFEKLLKVEPEDKPAISDTSKQTIEVLENRFLAFHARCHRQPTEFLTFTDKATQILQLVTVGFEEIKDRSLDKVVQKMCLINIAAEYLAWEGTSSETRPALDLVSTKLDQKTMNKVMEENDRNCQAVFLLQRFNILTFTVLLKVLARELASDSEAVPESGDEASGSVPPPVGRLLPHLRQYSSWLLSNINALLNPKHPSTQTTCLNQFWKAYVAAMNQLLSRYSIGEITDLNHLLEEDEDTLAFAPFTEKVGNWRYSLDAGPRKPAYGSKEDRPYEAEMLARIRRFVFDAATISNQQDALGIDWAPIAFDGREFHLQEKPVKAPEIVKPKTPSQPFRIRAHVQNNSINGVSPARSPRPEQPKENGSALTSLSPPDALTNLSAPDMTGNTVPGSEAVAMEDMVNNLLNHEAIVEKPVMARRSIQPRSPPFNSSSMLMGTERPTSSQMNIMDIVRNMSQKSAGPLTPPTMSVQGSHRMSNASIPGIWNTAFTPRLGETTAPTSRPVTASGTSSGQLQGSSALFQQELLQREREIQLRSSPQLPVDYSSWAAPYGTPPMQAHQHWTANTRSSWNNPGISPSQNHRQLSEAALYGTIGENRKTDARTPASDYSS